MASASDLAEAASYTNTALFSIFSIFVKQYSQLRRRSIYAIRGSKQFPSFTIRNGEQDEPTLPAEPSPNVSGSSLPNNPSVCHDRQTSNLFGHRGRHPHPTTIRRHPHTHRRRDGANHNRKFRSPTPLRFNRIATGFRKKLYSPWSLETIAAPTGTDGWQQEACFNASNRSTNKLGIFSSLHISI